MYLNKFILFFLTNIKNEKLPYRNIFFYTFYIDSSKNIKYFLTNLYNL